MDLRDQLQATLTGTYTLDRELGGGGMSRVFLAEARKRLAKLTPVEKAKK